MRADRQGLYFGSIRHWRPVDLAAAILLAVVSFDYFRDAITLSRRLPFWMDEVLSLWTAQMPSVGAVWSALERGSEFTPPLYDLFLHMLLQAGIVSPLALRLPSILACFFAAIAMGMLVKRYVSWPLAALATAAVLSSGMFEYAIQMRPYIFVAAAFAWALFLWDRLPQENISKRDLILFGILLIVMVALHFYAILLVLVIGAAEIIYWVILRKYPRWNVLIVILIAIGSIGLWWPIMQAASNLSRNDVWAPYYYGRPRLITLKFSYFHIIGIVGVALAMIGSFFFVIRGKQIQYPKIGLLSGLLYCIPCGVYLFALLVSHSYVDRYIITVGLGMSLLLVWIIAQLQQWSSYVALGALAFMVGTGAGGNGAMKDRTSQLDALSVLKETSEDIPIVTGNGLRFFEISVNSSPSIVRRAKYINLPNTASIDPTNRHQVERWKVIRPELPVIDAMPFVCSTPVFLLFHDPIEGPDDLPHWLLDHASFEFPSSDRASLTFVKSKPCIKK